MPFAAQNRRPDLNDWRVQRFLDWLCTIGEDRTPATQTALAEELDMNPALLSHWKSDGDFLRVWEQRYRKTVGSPEKAQQVINKLYETATDRTDPRQVPAARAYLEAVDAIKPKKIDIQVNRDPKVLSDEELMTILAEHAAKELEERADA
jgi:hypothetical protein